MTDQITAIVQQSGLQPDKTQALMKSFTGYFQEAKGIAEEAKHIIVTEESQTELMDKARDARLKLKNIRVLADKTRVELKEQSLREGRAIDGIANVIKALIIPVEEHLEKQEKFAELKEKARLEAKYADRISKLSAYVSDITLYNLRDMSDETFENLLTTCKKAFEDQKEAQKKAEQDRIDLEEKQNVQRHRSLEIAPYYQFLTLEETEIDINMSDEDYDKLFLKAKEAKKAHDAEQKKIRKENEELRKKEGIALKAKQEAEAKLKVEKDAQEKKEREEREKAEAIKKAEEDAKREALLAPDKDKLNILATEIDNLKFPAVQSNEAGELLRDIRGRLDFITNLIREKAKTL